MTTAAPSESLGTLPEWDLSDLYAGPDSPALAEDLAAAAGDAKAFRARNEGQLAGHDGARLAAVLREYEALQDRLGRIVSYAQLVHSRAMTDEAIGRFYQTTSERVNDVTADLLFFALELNRIEEDALQDKLADPALAHYGPWIRDTRAFRPHQLSDEAERLLHDKSVAGRAAWVRLYDETSAGL
ncbi:MAG: oligoendopeptidase F, partial [Alphaproteobacteria bacterium]